MSNLTTVAKVKEYLRVKTTDASQDEIFARLITSCSSLIESYLHRKILKNTYKDKFNGTNSCYHVMRNYPLISIDSITVNGRQITDFDFDEDQVYLTKNVFNAGNMNCSIEYQAGYEEVPTDIEQACVELVCVKYKQIDNINISSKAFEGATTSFIVKDIPDFVRITLDQYKNNLPL